MKIFASVNIKGGVGKTAATVNLAYLCAARNYRTLMWDLDPQRAASYYFRIKPRIKSGAKRLVNGKHGLSEMIKATDYANLDLIPADFSYRNMDLYLDETDKPTRRLRYTNHSRPKAYALLWPGISALVSQAQAAN